MNPFGNIDEGWRGWAHWFRNPLHNLFVHMMRRQIVSPVYVIGKPMFFFQEWQKTIVLRFRPFFLKIGYFFVGWRSDKPIAEWGGGTIGGAFDIGFKRVP